MPIRRPILALALSALAGLAPAVLAPAAHAGWFPGESIDGPSADIVGLGDVDLARDGSGAIVYLKREAGVPHVFLSRMVDGAWRAPERVDAGLEGPATAATVAAGDGRRLMVAFVSGGALYGVIAPGGGELLPLTAPQLLAPGSAESPVTDPHSDLGINGTGYVVFTANGDVGATRLSDSTWEPVSGALDVNQGQAAGDGTGRPRIAVSAEGNAVATWGESHPDGRRHVYGRRITGLTPSAAPQEVSLPDFGGAPGGTADSPDIDVEDDGSYAWVVWRQDFGGVSRTVARRLVGSLFEAPAPVDGGTPAGTPRFEMNGRGIGHAVAAGPSNTVVGAFLDKTDAFMPPSRLDVTGSDAATAPVVAVAERRQVGLVWRRSPGGSAPPTVQARFKPDEKAFEAETTLSVPEFGPVSAGPEISADKNGDFASAFLQGPPESRRLVAAVYDKAPATPVGQSTSQYQRKARPTLKWRPGSELWGPQQFRLFMDGAEIGTTMDTQFVVPAPLTVGSHRWRVESIDRRGQVVSSSLRFLRVDPAPPVVRLRVTGKRKRGRTLRIAVSATDEGTGLGTITVDYGDRTARSTARRSSHRYTRPGTFTLTARVADRAGNVTRKTVRLRIKR